MKWEESYAKRRVEVSDAEGRLEAPLPRAGRWLLHAVHLRKAADGVSWESDFTTLSLRVR